MVHPGGGTVLWVADPHVVDVHSRGSHAGAGRCSSSRKSVMGANHACRRGEDPEADAAEKALLRTARRGVVQLFNAVAKAQKQAAEAQAPGARAKVRCSCLRTDGSARAQRKCYWNGGDVRARLWLWFGLSWWLNHTAWSPPHGCAELPAGQAADQGQLPGRAAGQVSAAEAAGGRRGRRRAGRRAVGAGGGGGRPRLEGAAGRHGQPAERPAHEGRHALLPWPAALLYQVRKHSSTSSSTSILKAIDGRMLLLTRSAGVCAQDWDKVDDAELPVAEETMPDLGSDSDDS